MIFYACFALLECKHTSCEDLSLGNARLLHLNKHILQVEEPEKHNCDEHKPENLLLSLGSALCDSKHLLVRVALLFFLFKVPRLVHLANLFLGPHAFEVVGFELWAGRDQPPKNVNPHVCLCVVVKIVLLAILSLEVIDIALVVIDALELLLEELKRKVGEQDTLNERENAADESVWVPGLVHVVFGAGC